VLDKEVIPKEDPTAKRKKSSKKKKGKFTTKDSQNSAPVAAVASQPVILVEINDDDLVDV